MIVYAIAITASLLLSHYKSTSHELLNGRKTYIINHTLTAFLIVLPLFLVAAFRWNVGADSVYYSSYWQAYRAAANKVNSLKFEGGFYLLMRTLSSMKVPYFWFLFIHQTIFTSCFCYALKKGSVWISWSILVFFLLYVYFDSYSSLRQSLAESISLIAWAKMGTDKKSLKKDIQITLLFLLGTFFHSIAMINIPIYFACKVRFNRKSILLFIVLMVILTPAIQVSMKFLMRLIGGSDYTFIGTAVINAIMTAALCLLCWYFYDEICSMGEHVHMYVNLSVFIFLLILNSGAMYLPYRVFDMLKIGYVFIIPYLLRSLRSKRIRVCLQWILLATFSAWFLKEFFLPNSFVINYQSALEHWSVIIHYP